jgi:NodT family efflux transporter outer membrane factor (OMF) lipoprotein
VKHKHAIARFYLTLLFISMLGGCSMVGPDYAKPEPAFNERWVGEEKPGVERDTQIDIEWWKVFGDPVLDNLVDTAYRENLDLQIAAMRVLGSMAGRGVALGQLFPQSQAVQGNFLHQHLPGGKNPYYDNQWAFSFDASWELDIWGKIRRGIESASAQVDASIASYDDVMVSLISEVALAYVSIRVIDEQIAIETNNIKVEERSLQIAQDKYDAGKGTMLDIKQASSLLSQTRAALISSQASRRQGVYQLCALLGRTPNDLEDLLHGAGSIPEAPTNVAVGAPADLLRRRPDIRVAERQAAVQSALIGVQKAVLYPSFSLVGSIGLGADDFNSLWNASDSWTGLLNPGFSWPILNYGRIENNIRAQDAAFQAAALNYQNTVLNAAQEVESSLVGFRGARDQAGQLALSVAAAKEAADLSAQQYIEGAADYTRVLQAQQTLLEVESRHATVRGNVATNLIATYKALGGGWEIRKGLSEMVAPGVQEEMLKRTDWGDYFEQLRKTGERSNDTPFYQQFDPTGTEQEAGAPAEEPQP